MTPTLHRKQLCRRRHQRINFLGGNMLRLSSNVSTKIRAASLRRAHKQQRCKLSSESSKDGVKPATPAPPAPPPDPTPPPSGKGGGVFFKLLGLTTVGIGGVLAYAWYDAEFRKQLESNVPYSKEAMEYIFQYLPETSSTDSTTTSQSKPPAIAPAEEEPVWKKRQARQDSDKTEPSAKEDKSAKSAKQSAADAKKAEQTKVQMRLKEKEAEEAAENAALEVILEGMMDLLNEKSKQAIEAQKKVIEATKSHTQLLKTAMDDSSDILNKDNQWQAVANAFGKREDAVRASKQLVNDVKDIQEKMKKAIEDGKLSKITKKNPVIISAQESLNKFSSSINSIASEVSKAESDAKVMLQYKDLIDQGRKQFKQELESIMPEVKLGDKKGKKLTEAELNSLIAHAHRRIDQLQKQLAEQIAMETQRTRKTIEQQKAEGEKLALDLVKKEAERLQNEFSLEKQKWDIEGRVQFEEELRQQLKRQAAAHSDHLKDVLGVQREELEHHFDRELHARLIEERQSFQTEMAGWIARLKGIEAAVEGRAEQEKLARTAQELWLACVALAGAIRLGKEGAQSWEAQIKPLDKEIFAVVEAGANHPLVNAVIESIPEEAYKRGVWTEDGLRARFRKVRRVCKRVSMIDESGGTLFKYFISYIQSFFIFDSVYAKSESDEVDLDKLDTFAILAHAQYWVDKGDLELALRFMNQLQGEPRRVAADWIRETTLMLETRQAAQTLTAFASASGLGTIF